MGNTTSKSRCITLKTYGGIVAGTGFLMMGAYAYSPSQMPLVVPILGLGMFVAGAITAGVGEWGGGTACDN
jgi:hypothetical protein